ncbi:MAG: hypothetical protein HC822_02080 [Oscillochloris sp.]|nr:hypothetical protein [Oscillochloris sp.]
MRDRHNGAVAVLSGDTITRYNLDGSGATGWQPAGSGVDDIAIEAASGLVFVAGYTQKAGDLKVAYLRAYDANGTVVWTNYDHSASAVKGANLGADSEGRRVAIGRDGMLYFAGFTDGGNSIYQRDPRDIGRRLSNSEQINIDNYSNTSNISGAKSLAWFGRFNPADGTLLLGQWLLTRLNDGKGNSIGIKAISAAEDGTVLLAGDAYASLKSRTGMQFAGITLGGYEGGEPYFAVIAPDFRTRRIWTALAAPGTSAGSSPLLGAAIRRDALLVGGTLNPRGSGTPRNLITVDPLQAAPADGATAEGYLLVMPTP